MRCLRRAVAPAAAPARPCRPSRRARQAGRRPSRVGGTAPGTAIMTANGTANGAGAAHTSLHDEHAVVLVLDYGSQYTQLICRRIREIGVFSMMFPGDASMERIKSVKPKVIILSGGPNSVHLEGSPRVPAEFFDFCRDEEIPVLGICYGMQLIVQMLGGEVGTGVVGGEYGRMPILIQPGSCLYSFQSNTKPSVWMSHGDEATKLPDGFHVVAKSEQGAVVAIEHPERRIFGLQYHPEVAHTEQGTDTLRHFLLDIAGLTPDWTMAEVLETQVKLIEQQVVPGQHAICALSGGVDSTVAATLVHKVLGDRLHCVFVDHGLLRYKEGERVMEMFTQHLHLPVTMVDHSGPMLAALRGVADPEAKRKIIGAQFIEVFKAFAANMEATLGHKPAFLVQGTLYPDFKLIEPFRELFKDEVRAIGRLLGVPEQFIKRHPFPGPGMGVRILGDVTEGDRLEVLQLVDEIYVSTIKEFGLYDDIWQAFAVFLPIKSVGVQGDQRTHSHVVGLRAVTSSDGMTADWYPFSAEFLRTVSARICNQVRSVNRVVYDITSKPPSTIEWE
ncbi:guaA [Scenedesmus sp. PABB004]|nr:guaA [Scenedesmus sp. PABB004]